MGVNTFDELCDLVVLEQLKNSVPANVATYLTEHEASTPSQAAVLADEYVLLHRHAVSAGYSKSPNFRPKTTVDQLRGYEHSGRDGAASTPSGVCHYCKEPGHWKGQCALLKAKGNGPKAPGKPAALANSFPSSVSVMSFSL